MKKRKSLLVKLIITIGISIAFFVIPSIGGGKAYYIYSKLKSKENKNG